MQIRNPYVQKFAGATIFLSVCAAVHGCTKKSSTVLFPLVYGSRYESKKIDFY